MGQRFFEALGDFLAKHAGVDLEEVVDAMETHLAGLRDDIAARSEDEKEG